MAAMTKLPISKAYPLTSLGFVLILVLSYLFLGETFNIYKLVGVLLIMAGIFVSSQG
jgi:multidrug transporter EmrE-like cation transporter